MMKRFSLLMLALLAVGCGGGGTSSNPDGGSGGGSGGGGGGGNVLCSIAGILCPVRDAGVVPAACNDSNLVVGAPAMRSSSFDVDCAFATNSPDGGGVGTLEGCNALAFSIEQEDGGRRWFGDAGVSVYAATGYQPTANSGPVFSLIAVDQTAFADGWSPTFWIEIPETLRDGGTFGVAEFAGGDNCFSQGSCAGFSASASKSGGFTYELGTVQLGQVTVESVGGASVRWKFHSQAISLVPRPADSSQANCPDGLIHHQP